MKYMILAAGQGTRLKPVTDKIPKSIVPLLNVPMIFYPHQYFCSGEIMVNAFHLEQTLRRTLEKHAKNFGAEIISDGNILRGSGGGLKNAEDFFKDVDHLTLVNADSVFLSDDPDFLKKAEEEHKKNNALATIVVIEDARVKSQGWGAIWTDNQNKVHDMGKEQPSGDLFGYHFIGFIILSNRVFTYTPEGPSHIFDDVLKPAMAKKELVQIYKAQGQWFETGNQADYLLATQVLLKELQKNSKYLTDLQKQFHPHFKLFTKTAMGLDKPVNTAALDCLLMSDNFNVGGGVKLEGFVVLGDHVTIEAGSHITNSVILDNVTVPKNSIIKNQILF